MVVPDLYSYSVGFKSHTYAKEQIAKDMRRKKKQSKHSMKH